MNGPEVGGENAAPTAAGYWQHLAKFAVSWNDEALLCAWQQVSDYRDDLLRQLGTQERTAATLTAEIEARGLALPRDGA